MEAMVEKLESFQGELTKKILKCPRHHFNTAASTALDIPSMRNRLLAEKLNFLIEASSGR